MGGHAWVTLATNDSYSLGALVLAHSLKQVGTQQQLAVLITPGVTEPMRSKLSEVFNVVVEVNLLDSKDETNLRLLKRPELGVTFTKLHCWRLTQFDKCVFLDADTLVLENCDELFDRDELSAAPDIGWPDCFNSGVFVFRPSMETYEKLIQFALEKGSFDGGDQGLLNLYFSDWAHKDISKHLPFIYNMASTACYSYLPAFKQFGKSAKIIHFIGASKPWLQYFDTETRLVHPAEGLKHMQEIFQLWWNIFCNFIHPGLSPQMAGIAGAFAKLTLGSPRTAEQLALDDHLRRQGWEVGNIDYMGRDSFQNIWNKICETLSSPPEQPTTIKETSPPTAESKPVEDLPLEVKSDERSVEVASSEVQPIKDVIEAEPAEKPTSIPQECQVSQTTVTPAAETSQSLSSDEIAVSEKIVEAEISKTADKGESKTEAQATEPSVDKAQKSEAAPVQSQIATPTSVAQTQDVVTPEVGSQPVTETPTTKAPETPATSVPEISPAQAQETPVTAVTESATAKAPAATVPEPSPTKATETSVVTVPEASLAKAPVATVPEASPAKAPVVTVPEASLEKVPETPVKSVDEPTKVPESPIISPAESSKPFPVQPPPSPADHQLVTPVISAGDSSKAQPTLEQQPAKDSPTSVLEKSAAGDSTTPVAEATQPEPKQDSSTKKPIGKLNVAVAKASGAPAPKPQAEVTAPSPPTTPLSPQPQQVRVAKEASKVESTVPTTPPLDTQQTSSGPTPPPRKSSGGTKKATKPKK